MVCEFDALQKEILSARKIAIEMGYKAGENGAHFGAGMSAMEILHVLYGGAANISPQNCHDENRDRIIVSKGHCTLALYTALYMAGFLNDDDIAFFEKDGCGMPGHAIKNVDKGVEFATGSLGMGLSVACGMAYDAKVKGRDNRVFVLLGDGECEEGAVWEGFLFATHHALDNLTVIIDNNDLQYDGTIEEVAGLNNLKGKLEAFGLNVKEVDGHDVAVLSEVLQERITGKPCVMIAHTVKGKGISFMENNAQWHHGSLSREQYKMALEELGNASCH